MQVDGTRAYRVKAVAEMLDVSASTIYRAIQAGELDAYKLGAGKGAVRVPGHALGVYLDACGQAAYEEYVEGGADPTGVEDDELTPAQADGLACVVCGADYLTATTPHRPVGRSASGSQTMACTSHAMHAMTGGELGELIGEVAR